MSGRPFDDGSSGRFKRWLFDVALPFWADIGVDRIDGGFIERLDPDGRPLDDPRRARLVARQIYVFATAERLGWGGPGRELAEHGVAFLLGWMVRPDGTVVSSVSRSGEIVAGGFDLYDHAFALFGLAAAHAIGVQAAAVREAALRIVMAIERSWRHPVAGFEESRPRTLPLKANPHMHMLEAVLAWAGQDDDLRWNGLADEIAELCLSHFISRRTGALHEFFDGDWTICDDAPLDVVEPGHLFEWAWLLMRWGTSRRRPDAIAAADRLVTLAEGRGVSPDSGLAINELNADLSIRDGRHRLWPQTERIKAHLAMSAMTIDPAKGATSSRAVDDAIDGLMRFFDHPVRGSWWEHLAPDGKPMVEPARASSLYHIMCAFDELDRHHRNV